MFEVLQHIHSIVSLVFEEVVGNFVQPPVSALPASSATMNYSSWDQQGQLPGMNQLIPLSQVLVSPLLCEAFALPSGYCGYDPNPNPYAFMQHLESQPRFHKSPKAAEKTVEVNSKVLSPGKSESRHERDASELSSQQQGSGQQQVPNMGEANNSPDHDKSLPLPPPLLPPPAAYASALAAASSHGYLSAHPAQSLISSHSLASRHAPHPYAYGPHGQPMLMFPRDAAAFGLHGFPGQHPYATSGYPGPPFDYSSCSFPPQEVNPSSGTAAGSDEDITGDDVTARALKRPRLVWTPQLHKKFEEAINRLGPDKAVPKNIMQDMNVEGLTRENVASHLQKYRLQKKKDSSAGGGKDSDGEGDPETTSKSQNSVSAAVDRVEMTK